MREFAHLPLSCILPMVWMLCLRSDIILPNLGDVSMYKGTWIISCSRPHVWIVVMSCYCSWSVSGLDVSLFTFFHPFSPFQGHLPCIFHRNPWIHIIHGEKKYSWTCIHIYMHLCKNVLIHTHTSNPTPALWISIQNPRRIDKELKVSHRLGGRTWIPSQTSWLTAQSFYQSMHVFLIHINDLLVRI